MPLQTTPEQVREEITAMFQQHIRSVSDIYRNTEFEDGSGNSYKGFGFRVDRVLVSRGVLLSTDLCRCSTDLSHTLSLSLSLSLSLCLIDEQDM